MGAKASSLSCANCKKKRARYGVRSSTAHRRYQDSYYDAIAGSVIVSQRRRLGSTRTNRQASLNLVGLSQNEGRISYEDRHQSCDARLPSSGYTSNHYAAEIRQSTAENSGNSCRIREENDFNELNKPAQECPEMSTISLGSGAVPPSGLPSAFSEHCTPTDARRTEDVMFTSRFYNSDVTDTTNTLAAPPNSLNSQFISGITPLDSAQEGEYLESNDSVFEPDTTNDIFRTSHAEYFPPLPTILLNNNALPHPSNWDNERENSSDGPGLDSDFGLSAGVEMKIVSSDNTAADSTPLSNAKASAMKRWIPARRGSKRRKMSKKELLRDDQLRSGTSSSSRSNLCTYYRPHPLLHIPTAPHSCPAVASDNPSLHVTLEWDPYDPNYGQWREYIIPGVTYPPIPLLSERQYWL